MIRWINKARDNEEGFTLVELLVVVIIIGILAAIAIPVFLNQRQSAWTSAVESDLRNAAVAQETYYTSEGAYTDDLDDLIANGYAVTEDVQLDINLSGTQEFCIEGDHANLDDSPVAVYDSTEGGVERGGSC